MDVTALNPLLLSEMVDLSNFGARGDPDILCLWRDDLTTRRLFFSFPTRFSSSLCSSTKLILQLSHRIMFVFELPATFPSEDPYVDFAFPSFMPSPRAGREADMV